MNPRYFSKDIRCLLLLLEKHGVRYVIIGGDAVIYHGYPRVTGDMDVFFESTLINVNRLWKSLLEFWGGDVPGIGSKDELLKRGSVLQFGVVPNRIDLLNTIDGVTFQEAWKGKVLDTMVIGGTNIRLYFIGLDSLIKNKEAVKRNKDIDDLCYLKEVQKRKGMNTPS